MSVLLDQSKVNNYSNPKNPDGAVRVIFAI